MSTNATTPRRRGRPARSEIDTIRTKAWFMHAGHFLGSCSGYAFEKRFSPKKSDPGEIVKRTCRFDKYKRGEHTPNQEIIDTVEKAFPGTKATIEHPLWEIARCPCSDLDALYNHLQRLRPELVNLLFHYEENAQATYQRRSRNYIDTFDSLVKEGDIDALAACIGLVQEAKYYGDELMWFIYTRPTFTVFRRSISEMPFFFVAAELYAYLMEFILDNQDGEEIMKNTSADIVYDLAFLSNTRLLIIEDYELLKHYYFTPRACLHIAEKYLDASTLKAIWDLTVSGRWPEIPKLPEFKKLSRALKRWELKHMPATRH